MKKISDFPKRYYGLHFSPGVVEYPGLGKRVFISPEVSKEMDPSFSGKPLFVQHRDDYEVETLPAESDGVVVKSFYNMYDGNHWVEFLTISDEADQKIKEGWLLSNSYKAQVDNVGGESKNVSYDHAVSSAIYHHMALVKKPRYENSVIYSPEEFKAYNDKLKAQLEHLQNSKEEDSIMFFKKTKAENSDALKDMSVVLPKSKVEKTVMQLINEADETEASKSESKKATDDMLVTWGEEEVTVGQLKAKLQEFIDQAKEAVEEFEEVIDEDIEEETEEEKLDNKEEKKDDKKDEKKLDNSKTPKFASLKLKNASEKGLRVEEAKPASYASMAAQLQLGKDKY